MTGGINASTVAERGLAGRSDSDVLSAVQFRDQFPVPEREIAELVPEMQLWGAIRGPVRLFERIQRQTGPKTA